jgi:hypothetical protein
VNRGILPHCFFWFSNTGADAPIAILMPTKSILFAMEPWNGAQHAFAVKTFYKNGDSLVIFQRNFQREFGIHRNRAVPSAHVIKTWVRNFEATGSTLKKKGDSVKSAECLLQTS